MAKSILITSIEGHSGKSLIALGVIDALSRATARVGVFRPVTRASDGTDDVLEMLLSRSGIGLPAADCIGVGYDELHADPDAALGRILERFHAVEARSDAVVILGSDYTDVAGPAELGLNARIAANLGATVLLGCVFLYFQATEYIHAYTELNLTLGSGIYGSTFFMLTGFHGAHVTLGTIMLAIIWLRVAKGHFSKDNHFAFEAVAWYWHFVDVVWLGLFLFVYVL